MVIQVRNIDLFAVTSQASIVLFFSYLFNKEIKKQVTEVKTSQTLRHAITLAQEAEINLKKTWMAKHDDSSVRDINAVSQNHPDIMTIQNQDGQAGNQNYNANIPKLIWMANLMCYKCGDKGHLTREYSNTGKKYMPCLSQHRLLLPPMTKTGIAFCQQLILLYHKQQLLKHPYHLNFGKFSWIN